MAPPGSARNHGGHESREKRQVLLRSHQRRRRRQEGGFVPDPASVSREKFREEREALRNLEGSRRRSRLWRRRLSVLLLPACAWWCRPLWHQVEGFFFNNKSLPPWFGSAAAGVLLPTERLVERLLEPLESSCFTYRPTAWAAEGNETIESRPFVFQWCHKGRATIQMEGARVPLQVDLGTSEETTISLGPPVPGWEEREEGNREQYLQRFFPAVTQHFTGGAPCPLPDAHRGGFAEETDGGGGERAATGQIETGSSCSDGNQEERRVRVNIWCCGSAGDQGDVRRQATIVNLVQHGEGESTGKGASLGCPSLVASVCTQLLCPVYPKIDEPRHHAGGGGSSSSSSSSSNGEEDEGEEEGKRTKNRGIFLETGAYKLPAPEPFVSRPHRGFLEYDRQQPMSQSKRAELREEIREMFIHSYDGYMKHAFPGGELLPLSCGSGELHLVKVPLVTLVDTLDSLVIMGNATEFRRAVRLVSDGLDVEADVDVSVFESNIRLLGGLLSAHLLATDPDLGLYPSSNSTEGSYTSCDRYDGELLVLAESLGRRLLPAFETPTGIPYGTVNLKRGVPLGETTESSLAGAGSLSLEFSVLSALTGDGVFAEAAEGAVKALFKRRSAGLGLLGKHIDSKTGKWTETSSGIGTNGDSFYEYLLKMYVLWGDLEYWDMFMQAYVSIQRFLREGDWYADTEMNAGYLSRRTFDNLMAFWPGMQTLIGDFSQASCTLNAFYLIWRDWGFLPEQFDHEKWALIKEGVGRAYPLRPELVESTLMVYRSTGDPSWLWAGKDFLGSLKAFCRTECGYAGVLDVEDTSLDEQMPSFFLSETLKYLYLLFDEGNFLHRGNFVFSTEAHPFSVEAVRRGGHSPGGDATDPHVNGSTDVNGIGSSHVGQVVETSRRTTEEKTTSQKEEKPRRGDPPDKGKLEQTKNKDKETRSTHKQQQAWKGWWQKIWRYPGNDRNRSRRSHSQRDPNLGDRGSWDEHARDDDAFLNVGDSFGDGSDGVASWAAWRASMGERHSLGPGGWRDDKIIFWAQGGDLKDVENTNEDARPVVLEELRYMGHLWRMYMDRMCPVLPLEFMPTPYSPETFSDSLSVGGRPAWLMILGQTENGADAAGASGDEPNEQETQRLLMKGVGVIEVTADSRNNFVLHHRSSGETLEVSHIYVQGGGIGVPGSANGGAMQITSYVRPRQQQQQQQQQQEEQQPHHYQQILQESKEEDSKTIDRERVWKGEGTEDQSDTQKDKRDEASLEEPSEDDRGGEEIDAVTPSPASADVVATMKSAVAVAESAAAEFDRSVSEIHIAQAALTLAMEKLEAAEAAMEDVKERGTRDIDAPEIKEVQSALVTVRLAGKAVRLAVIRSELKRAMLALAVAESQVTFAILAAIEEGGNERRVMGDEANGRGLSPPSIAASEDGRGGVKNAEATPPDAKERMPLARAGGGRKVEGESRAQSRQKRTGSETDGGKGREVGRGRPAGELEDKHNRGRRHSDPRGVRGSTPRNTILVTKEGLTVYCAVSVAGTDYPCSLSLFSAPGTGTAVVDPVYASLHVVEALGVPGKVSLGCHLDHDSTTAPEVGVHILHAASRGAASRGAASPAPDDRVTGGEADDVNLSYFAAGVLWWRHLSQVARQRHRSADAPPHSQYGSDAGPYSGKILLVSRGECTFEQKAAAAQAVGAVGLVIINNEPGGGTFAMPGVNDHDDSSSGVRIPVAMVGMEDGEEIVRTWSAAAALDEFRRRRAIPAVLDARTNHQSVYSRLVREQREGLRDTRGSLLDECGRSAQCPSQKARTNNERESDNTPNGRWGADKGLGYEERENVDGFSVATPMSNGAASSKGAREVQDVEAGDMEVEEDEDAQVEESGVEEGSTSSGENRSRSGSREHRFSFLKSGFDETTLGGMRPPPFSLPKVIISDDYVQVMGLGHWGILVFEHNGAWALSLTPNIFNPPPPPPPPPPSPSPS